jgi:hypothetical protein
MAKISRRMSKARTPRTTRGNGRPAARAKAPRTPRTARSNGRPAAKVEALPYEVSERVGLQALTQTFRRDGRGPTTRPLRIYTLDPSVSQRLGGTTIVNVPLEPLRDGPVGSLFAIDPGESPFHARPLDLEDSELLLTSGVTPSPADSRFPLQMVYAVCSLTYAAFQRALGRDVAWACGVDEEGRRRLRVRPFGSEERNAYYDRDTGCISFGYFRARKDPAGHTVPRGWIMTALSHDVVVHETTHALLDGLRSEFSVPSTPDVLGFHEGFADIVAILQHFTYPQVVEQGIRDSRGSLAQAALLTNLAQEFGHATSSPRKPTSLRSAIDVKGMDPFDSDSIVADRQLVRFSPDLDAHDMGSVLVSAVFEAFVTIFRRKTERYFRLAGIDPDDIGRANLSPDLVQILAQEASVLAGQFLNICIRAIDYCPPVDLEMGEYLRALITADAEMLAEDPWGYREALIRSFQRRRIFPDHVPFMSEDALKWQPCEGDLAIPQLAFRRLRFQGDPGRPSGRDELIRQARVLGEFVTKPKNAEPLHLFVPGGPMPKGLMQAAPPMVQSIRCARRVTPDGGLYFDLVAEVTQSCTAQGKNGPFDFFGGCTLVINPEGRLRYAIYKKLGSLDRQQRQAGAIAGPLKNYWKKGPRGWESRPGVFKTLHRMK